jgi:hypothetical protein
MLDGIPREENSGRAREWKSTVHGRWMWKGCWREGRFDVGGGEGQREVRLMNLVASRSCANHRTALCRYRVLLDRTYVDDSPQLRWCPHPECEYAVYCKDAPARKLDQIVPIVHCACGNDFCFGSVDNRGLGLGQRLISLAPPPSVLLDVAMRRITNP